MWVVIHFNKLVGELNRCLDEEVSNIEINWKWTMMDYGYFMITFNKKSDWAYVGRYTLLWLNVNGIKL